MIKVFMNLLRRNPILYLILSLLVFTLACRMLYPAREIVPTIEPTSSPTATIILPTKTVPAPTPTPTVPSPTPTPTATRTPLPTKTPRLELSPTPALLLQDVQLRVFEDLWAIVNEQYLYPDFNGLDWQAIRQEYKARIEQGLNNTEFYLAMDEMISRLGDDHSVFLGPEAVADEEAQLAGHLDYVGVGVLASPVVERQRAVILLVFPGSPADKAGLRSRDSILSVDGEPVLDSDGFIHDVIRGPEGTQVTLTVQTPYQEPRQVTMTRQRISSSMPVPHTVLTTPSGLRIGYILLVTFADGTVSDSVGQALKEMTVLGKLDGLVIDNRMNSGGVDTVLRGTLAYFTGGKLGSFISRGGERDLLVTAEDINGSQEVPLVVLVGIETVSYGEVFAGVLQDIGRAYLIGEATEGNVETLWGYDFEDGSRAWIAHESFRPFKHPEQNWEQTGIVPDQTVLVNWDEVSLEKDPAVNVAIEYFEK